MKHTVFIRLEERILFDAAAAAEIADAENMAEAGAQPEGSDVESQDKDNAAEEAINAVMESSAALPVPETPEAIADMDAQVQQLIEGPSVKMTDDVPKKELVVINSSVQDMKTVEKAVGENAEVVVLSQRNGLTELLDQLKDSDVKYDAVHFITHGNENEISINGDQIRNDNFDASPWQELGTHLNQGADLLFYGCDAASTESGRLLIDSISEAAGADVAASDDTTGANGDWDLEYNIGTVETAAISVDGYDHDLAEKSVNVSAYSELSDALSEAADGTYSEYTITLGADIEWDGTDTVISVLFDHDLDLTLESGTGNTLTGNEIDGLLSFTVDSSAEVTVGIEGITFKSSGDSALEFRVLDGVGNLNIRDSVFQDNVSTSDGGAINILYSDAADGNVVISGSYFTGNTAVNQGGAINITGGALSISHTTFNGNSVSSDSPYGGGAISATDTDVTIQNSTFHNNSAGIGGALHFTETSGVVNIANILDSTFSKNTASEGNGGNAIHNENVNMVVANSILVNATADSVDVYDASSTQTTRLIYSIYGNTNVTNLLSCTAGKVASDILEDYDATTHTIAIKNNAEAAYTGTLLGSSGSSYFYSNDNGSTWKNVADDTSSVSAVTAITGDQLSGDRNKWTTDFGIYEYAVGALVPANLLITAQQKDQTYTYDGLTHNSDLVYQSVGGQTLDAAKITGVIAGKTSSKNAGTYTVTPDTLSAEVIGKTGYEFQAKTGTITIEKLALSNDVVVTTSKVYDGTTNAAYTGGLTNVVTGDEVVLNAKFDYDNANVGTGKTITATTWNISGTDSGNYDLAAFTPVTGEITKATLTVTASGQNLTYGEGVTGKEYTVTGWVPGEAKTDIGTMGIDNASRSTSGNLQVGQTYNFTQGDLKADNYTIEFHSAEISVSKLALTNDVVVTTSKVYDGTTNAAYTGGLTNVVTGDEVVLNAKFDYDNANVGTGKTITATTWNITGDDSGNYDLAAFTPVTGEITKATLTVTASGQNLTYGEGVTGKEYTVTGWVPGEAKTDIGTMGIDNASRSTSGNLQVGQTYNFTQGDLKADNYTIEFHSAEISVSKLALTNDVVVTTSKVYDGTTNAAYTGGLTNVVSGDVVTLNAKFDYDNANVGTGKTITATTWNISGTDSGNYDLAAFTPISGNITPKSVTMISGSASKVYDGTPLTNHTVTADGFVSGEGASFDVTGSQTEVGSSPNTFTYTLNTGTIASNYAITKIEGTLTVIVKPVPQPEKPSRLNEDSFSAGPNPNYSAVAVTLVNRISSRMFDFGSPYSLRFPELISAELKNTTVNNQIDLALMTRENLLTENRNGIQMNLDAVALLDESMVLDNPMQIIGSNLTSGKNLVNLRGFSTGNELQMDSPVLPEELSDVVEVNFHLEEEALKASAVRPDIQSTDLVKEPDVIPALKEELAEKVSSLKSYVERILDEFFEEV